MSGLCALDSASEQSLDCRSDSEYGGRGSLSDAASARSEASGKFRRSTAEPPCILRDSPVDLADLEVQNFAPKTASEVARRCRAVYAASGLPSGSGPRSNELLEEFLAAVDDQEVVSLAELRRLFRDLGASAGREAVLRETGARFTRIRDGTRVRTAFGVEACDKNNQEAELALDMSGFVLGLLAGASAFDCDSPCTFLQQRVIPHAKAVMRTLGERCAAD